MRKFHFALDGLVRVREHEVRVQRARVASAAKALQQARDRSETRQHELHVHLGARPGGARLDLESLRVWDENRAEICRRMEREMETVELWAKRLQEEQHELELTHRRQEAVLKLRERRYVEFMRALLREEQQEVDERTGQRAAETAWNDDSAWEQEAA